MKKLILTLITSFFLLSCLDEVENSSQLVILPIESYTTPANFIFGQSDTIKINYLLPNDCFSFKSVYYQTVDTTRIVAVNGVEFLRSDCGTENILQEKKFVVTAAQREDYLFKFFKGVDENGINIFEEVIVPVN